MKTLFDKDLCPRPFGSAVFNVPALLEWATKKGLSLPTVPPLTDFAFAQAECVLSLIANRPHHSFTPDEAHAIAAANPLLAHHPAAQSAAPTAVWLVGAEASRPWREILSTQIFH